MKVKYVVIVVEKIIIFGVGASYGLDEKGTPPLGNRNLFLFGSHQRTPA